jgi:hypothetical protein
MQMVVEKLAEELQIASRKPQTYSGNNIILRHVTPQVGEYIVLWPKMLLF